MTEEVHRNYLEICSIKDLNEVNKPSEDYSLDILEPISTKDKPNKIIDETRAELDKSIAYDTKPRTFNTKGFVDDLFYAKKVAQFLDVDLEILNAEVNILDDFDKMIWHLEEPQADPAPLNVLNICKRAREMGYKVLKLASYKLPIKTKIVEKV